MGRRTRTVRIATNFTLAPDVQASDGSYRDHREMWIHRISGGIHYGILQSSSPVAVVKLPADCTGMVSESALISAADSLDGLILLRRGYGPEVDAEFARQRKPIVSFHPGNELSTANFVTFDPKRSVEQCATAGLMTKRRRFLLMLRSSLEDETFHCMRHQAMLMALRPDIHRDVEIRVAETDSHRSEAGRRAMRDVWESGYRPDFIFCSGDLLALGALETLEAYGVSIPSECSVVGGSGFDLSHESWPDLTRTRQPLETLGQELLGMLCRRIALGGVDLPGVYLDVKFRGGGSTRPEENEILGLRGSRMPRT